MAEPSPEGRKIALAHRLQDLAVGGVAGTLRLLPEAAAQAAGAGAGWLAGSLFRVRRGTIDGNLRRAFPSRPERWRRRVAARVFPHIGREAATLLRLPALGADGLRARTHIEGLELLEEAVESGRGALVLTGHVGNWEIGGGSVALRGLPLDVVAQPQANPLVDARLRRARERLGMRVIYRHDAARQVLRSLRKGRIVALVADQNVRSGGVFVPFFGIPASTARGPALFALRSGSPIIVGTAIRLPGWRTARYRVRFRPLAPELTGDVEVDVRRVLRGYLELLEEVVRDVPEQYFWPHKRWKTRPAEDPGTDGEPEEPFGMGSV